VCIDSGRSTNPCFRLRPIARRIIYLGGATEIEGYLNFEMHINRVRSTLAGRTLRPWRDLPM
jgi:hypothetical protein